MSLIPVPAFYQDSPKKKICLALFNRATYSRCKSLIEEIVKYPHFELHVVLSSSLLWSEFGRPADYIQKNHPEVRFELIEVTKTDGTHLSMATCAGEIAQKLAPYLAQGGFHCVVVVADRFETLPAAMVASYLNIPVVHIQGGEVTGCIDDKVRNAVTKLADYHFTATDLAKDYVMAMGEEYHRVFNVGCPSIDLIRKAQIKRQVAKEKYILCMFHSETENSHLAFEQTQVVMEAVMEYCAKFAQRCYWFYPNPDPGREEIIQYLNLTLRMNPSLLIKAINKKPEDFLEQLAGARLIIGNSSCGIREASYLGLPSVNVGSRQKMRERSLNVMDVGYDKQEILNALEAQHIQEKYYSREKLYGDGHAGRSTASYFAKLNFSLKGPLTYPLTPKFKERHFGEERLYARKTRKVPASR